jgi:flagellar biosynthesis activator protein FlaF
MNAQAKAQEAYSASGNAHKTLRSIEYDVFAQITSRLRQANTDGKSKFPELVSALDDNRKLWCELAFDLASPKNALPAPLRAQLLSLAQFTLNHTDMVLKDEADISILIDLNLSIMRGLAGQGDTR